ncbi:MAG: adenine deaminase [Bacteroidales bacterium]|nr:adenine deaminase [Bacteroidales bacterium]MCF8457682.1 adenine deaminase [Bacteroidales bacterium]
MESYFVEGNIVDVVNRKFIQGKVFVENGKIKKIVPCGTFNTQYILPGLIDAHVHIESSMLVPSEFAKVAVKHGTVATVSDPHEIANVLGVDGVKFMIENSKKVPFKIFWGAPSCVPATNFETSGFTIDSNEIEKLLSSEDIYYLSEVMNYPGVIYQDPEVIGKIEASIRANKPIDGHAPGIIGEQLEKYAKAGITTDHECFTIEEALDKIKNGITIQIREGSAAKNFDSLFELVDEFPDKVMLCSDDLHPDDLLKGHINLLIRKGIDKGLDFFNLLRVSTVNPIKHYNINVGLLQKGDAADFILVDNLDDFNIKETFINGIKVFDGKNSLIGYNEIDSKNNFHCSPISEKDIEVDAMPGQQMNVIEVIDKELITKSKILPIYVHNGKAISNINEDILKIVIINRYKTSRPQVGFIQNFGLKTGALGSCIAHDSHNIIAVGCSDAEIVKVVNAIIENKGGIAICYNNQIESLELEIAGIMTSKDASVVATKYESISKKAKELGSSLTAPLMTLSFMALLVIPNLKIGDKGLFDGEKFSFTDLIVG